MPFGTQTERVDQTRMRAALGRWTAQYQKQPAASRYSRIVDTPSEPQPGMKQEKEAGPRPGFGAREGTSQSSSNGAPKSEKTESRNEAGEKESRDFHRAGAEEQPKDKTSESSEKRQMNFTDYYEILQISRNADSETIHRVYRIMASRFHPDNPRTGDPERFQLLRKAYHVLSDAGRRAEYDRSYTWTEARTMPIFELKDFVDGVDGEKNRRLGVLSLLYHRRRLSERPNISLLDLEQRMGLPREYLNFTMWYLKSKGYVRCEDNSDFGLTADGVDYLETNSSQSNIIRDLLEAGTKGETGANMGPASTNSPN